MAQDFATVFGASPDIVASAPGRVNLIGEHTDYNEGVVLPLPLPQRTVVHLRMRSDDQVRVASADAEGTVATFTLGAEARRGAWVDYVQGCTAALAAAGHVLRGFDAWITSTVPVGSGLSSSAALTVAVLRGLRHAFALDLDDVAVAQVAQQAENGIVGARVGIMDHMVVSVGTPDAALFLDCRTLATERVVLPADMDLVVIDSGIRHANATGEYNTRRQECAAACAALGVRALRDVVNAPVPGGAALPPPLDRRARHVVTENARVVEVVAACRAGDVGRIGALVSASHASLRDDYEVTVPDVDRLVDLAADDPAVLGARMTGGGFGGAIVAVTRAGQGAASGARVVAAYGAATGRRGRVVARLSASGPS